MPSFPLALAALGFALATGTAEAGPIAALPAAADSPDLTGNWKLTVLAIGDDDFAIIRIDQKDGMPKAEIKNFERQLLPAGKISRVEQKGEKLTLDTKVRDSVYTFIGWLAKEGPRKGQILGSYYYRETLYPARLERTEAEEVKPFRAGPLTSKLGLIARAPEREAKITKLKELGESYADTPASYLIYNSLVQSAVAQERPEAEVRGYIDTWMKSAGPYGQDWTNEVRLKLLRSIVGKKPYAALALEQSSALDKNLSEDATDAQRSEAAHMLAATAKAAGNAALAASASERAEKLDSKLDEEYRAKVPPFKPEPYAGRKDAKSDRVVLLELFTGAECPPCVAADVAFDALNSAYKPAELVTLQYHLHIPGPDPLTNEASTARASYYQVRSTPSTFFNGKGEAAGGGRDISESKGKFDQYRDVIKGSLESARHADIDLAVKRTGDAIEIKAAAKTLDPPKAAGNGQGVRPSNPRLRIVLAEETIRYAGGNKLRLHHHVVRALPGGPEGTELADGRCQANVTVSLDKVHSELETYVSEFEKTHGFPRPAPEIQLKNLFVVAFVQEDDDKSVLHAVMAPVPEAEGK